MKQLYRHLHEGIRFSKNGHRAYLRGEKPKMLWPKDADIEPTAEHHLEFGQSPNCRRPLVMFYRKRASK